MIKAMTTPNRIVRQFIENYAPRKHISNSNNHSGVAEPNGEKKPADQTCLLVVSSTSGFGNAACLAPSVANRLAQSFLTVVLVPTKHKGHAHEIMLQEENLSQYAVAVILGGDGAFSEAVNGMLCRSDGATIKLAHCPGGSGCAIAGNTMNTWKGADAMMACDIIARRQIALMDVIQIECPDGTTRYSTSCIAGGLHVDTIDLADHYRWTYYLFGPMFRYVIGLIGSFWRFGSTDKGRALKYTIHYNDRPDEVFELPTVALALYNCGRVSLDSKFASANIFSGDLSLSLNKTYVGLGGQLKYVGALKKNQGKMDTSLPEFLEFSPIHFDKTVKSITVEPVNHETHRPFKLAFDGEMGVGNNEWMEGSFTARVIPEKIEVVVA